MKTFSIFEHPDQRLIAVKRGLSIIGLFLGGFWLLWHRVWVLGALAVLLGLGVYLLFPNPEGYLYGVPYGHRFGFADISNVVICLAVGFLGNEWRTKSLRDRGFEHVSTETAKTPDGAIAAYIRRDPAADNEPTFMRREPF